MVNKIRYWYWHSKPMSWLLRMTNKFSFYLRKKQGYSEGMIWQKK